MTYTHEQMKFRVETENTSQEFVKHEDALEHFEWKKDYLMSEGVTENSYVELQSSDDDFDDYIVLKRVNAVIDHDRTELRTPREEGYDWDYWAKWKESLQGG